MIRSMTGFGRAEASHAGTAIRVEVRAVNGRSREVRARLPRELLSQEAELRRVSGEFFGRGQVEISIRLSGGAHEPVLELDLDTARRYSEAAATLRDRFGIEGPLSAEGMLGLPGVARLREPDGPGEEVAPALFDVVRSACLHAREMREREGRALDQELRDRLAKVEKRLEEIETRADEIKQGLRDRLERRLTALGSELEFDPARLDQEVFLYVERMDVTEETIRQRSHLEQFRETLDLPGTVGRKLEFLLQEMAREANTIGQKVSDSETGRAVIELKAEIERLREQVANIE
ncbi:MAG: YicC family protein [Myxococcales bacterium]|nr:YicC family protein [Myxococcales bacterium]